MLSIRNLRFGYGERPVFCDYSVEIPARAVCIAPNGAGKTTLLRIVAGIATPESGAVLVGGTADYCASVLLSDDLLLPHVSLARQFSWISSETGLSRDDLRRALEPFRLAPYLDRSPHELSQGERQWATIAFVCAMPADIYLLDEPMRFLDADRTRVFFEYLADRPQMRCILTAHAFPAGCPLAEWRLF